MLILRRREIKKIGQTVRKSYKKVNLDLELTSTELMLYMQFSFPCSI